MLSSEYVSKTSLIRPITTVPRMAIEGDVKPAAWKILDDKEDPMYTKSYSQSLLDYIPPAEGTVPTEHRHPRGQFGEYLNKAIQLKVNLKSTAH